MEDSLNTEIQIFNIRYTLMIAVASAMIATAVVCAIIIAYS